VLGLSCVSCLGLVVLDQGVPTAGERLASGIWSVFSRASVLRQERQRESFGPELAAAPQRLRGFALLVRLGSVIALARSPRIRAPVAFD